MKQREQTEPMEGKKIFAVGQTVKVLWNERDLKGTNCTSCTQGKLNYKHCLCGDFRI